MENSSTSVRTVSTEAGDRFRAVANHFERCRVGTRAALQVPADALGGKRNRRKRVLDLVRHPARHFAPCGLLLRLQQVRQIFKDQHVPEALFLMLQGGHGEGRIQLGARQRDFSLAGGNAHAIGAAQQDPQIFYHIERENILLVRELIIRAVGSRSARPWDGTCAARA